MLFFSPNSPIESESDDSAEKIEEFQYDFVDVGITWRYYNTVSLVMSIDNG